MVHAAGHPRKRTRTRATTRRRIPIWLQGGTFAKAFANLQANAGHERQGRALLSTASYF